jgi:hypothetical protein
VSILSSLRDLADGDVINPALKRRAIFSSEERLQYYAVCSNLKRWAIIFRPFWAEELSSLRIAPDIGKV